VSVRVVFPSEICSQPLCGRLLLLISNDPSEEPRFQINDGPDTQLVFGVDVLDWQPDEPWAIDASAVGYPLETLTQLPRGRYWVQALLHRYETFHRSDGHVVQLPMDRGEGQQWNLAPGNLYSQPLELDLGQGGTAQTLVLDQEIAPFPPREDTRYLRHIRIQSELLTGFWGRPMHLEAIVLLPEGFDEHPEARYPLLINHGHHSRQWRVGVTWRETPVDAEKEQLEGYALTQAEYSYGFYRDWTGPDLPRVLIATIQHANPYYDDSYAVNSANLGPYGDAINYELLPEIERVCRAIGEPWARTLYGGSTGGWEALASQIFYPQLFNGCWANCPDPVDFSGYTSVNIYEHANAYFSGEGWKRTPRPAMRTTLGDVVSTVQQVNQRELALGSHNRSGQQYDIWEAVFGPVGADGYPRRIWDKRTGEIDPAVAAYWRENYDLRHILARDWQTLGPQLEGKLHVYMGEMDNFYLNGAVYRLEQFLESTTDPWYAGEIRYGARFGHCWSGDPGTPLEIARLTLNQRLVPQMVAHILNTAPAGADTSSWRY
jgi:hypothetical protein